MASDTHAHSDDTQKYYVPEPSAWPFMMVASMFIFAGSFAAWLNGFAIGHYGFALGLAMIFSMAFVWFRGVVRESLSGAYHGQEDLTFRYAMAWFIFSEVMFFGAFFGALFYARHLSLPWLGGDGTKFATNEFIWNGFENSWPSNGPGLVGGHFETIPPWGIPFINTVFLITSGMTFEFAHHAIKLGKRYRALIAMCCTVALGCGFLYFQAHEYIEAYTELNLTLGTGIYGSTFFMLTGFHGLHVTLGTIMLIVITLRIAAGHFKPDDSHFGFEAVGWYWHFVDVVWIGLFVFVYVL